MSNPTREEVELHKLENHSCLMCDRIGDAYLHALDMRDELTTSHTKGFLYRDTPSILKKFDGGNSEPVPEEAQRCSHGIPRKECGDDDDAGASPEDSEWGGERTR